MLTAQLRRILMALVLLNLVFVQITGAVHILWILPLFGLTLAAPMLWNLQRHFLYRQAWNVALVAIFALLLVDIRQSGIRFMLEDGLILAAFCQVHVLNNLIKQKRPDLIFFNSFLIALVTGFFCQDVVYSAVFAVYAVLLLFAMALATASTVDGAPSRILPIAEYRQLVRRSLRQGLVVMSFTGLVFTFWPRDFHREGLVEDQLASSAAATEVAFADEIRFDRRGSPVRSDRLVLRIRLQKGSRDAVPSHWRGATFTTLHRSGWTADTNPQRLAHHLLQTDEPWVRRSAKEFYRLGHDLGASVSVDLLDRDVLHLFVPAASHRVKFDCRAFPNVDGNFRVSHHDGSNIHYDLDVNPAAEPTRRTGGRPSGEHRRLRARAIPEGIRPLDVEVRKRLRPEMSDREKVEVIRTFLTTERGYALPGDAGAADSFRAFLAGQGGGHCEYFATTMVVLLRLQDISCRMVSGYLAHEWNEAGTLLQIRSDDAHAWVEVWHEDKGWETIDPTPPQDEALDGQPSLLATAGGWLRSAWHQVTNFDGSSRDAALAWAGAQLRALNRFLVDHPVAVIGTLVAAFAVRRRWRRRRGQLDPEVVAYRQVLTRLRLQLLPGETPRQLLARANAQVMPEDDLARLAAATDRHETARYR